jgi:hypothetical protein
MQMFFFLPDRTGTYFDELEMNSKISNKEKNDILIVLCSVTLFLRIMKKWFIIQVQ